MKEDLAVQRRQGQQIVQSTSNGAVNTSSAVPSLQHQGGTSADGSVTQLNVPTADWEYVDEIVAMLKTASPLLALTLETMVDQFTTKFKATPEEEIYRFTFILLQDGVQVSISICRIA